MGEAAADGAAVAYRAIGDARRRPAHQPARHVRHLAVLDRGVDHRGADCDPVFVLGNLAQLGDRRQIDQERGSRDPEIEHGAQRLAAGQRPRLAVGRAQEADRLLQACGAGVVERRRLHRAPPRRIASNTRRGVIGVSAISTPSPLSASLTALPMAPTGPIAPDSPTPLIPIVE